MQSTLSENSRLYKEIYDSGNLRVRTFLTKLLGTFQIEDEQGREARNCIIDSVTSETVEGLPGVSSTLIRFSETNSIQDEEVNVADARDTTSTLEAKYKAAYFSALGLGQRALEQEELLHLIPLQQITDHVNGEQNTSAQTCGIQKQKA